MRLTQQKRRRRRKKGQETNRRVLKQNQQETKGGQQATRGRQQPKHLGTGTSLEQSQLKRRGSLKKSQQARKLKTGAPRSPK